MSLKKNYKNVDHFRHILLTVSDILNLLSGKNRRLVHGSNYRSE